MEDEDMVPSNGEAPDTFPSMLGWIGLILRGRNSAVLLVDVTCQSVRVTAQREKKPWR